MDEAYQAYIIRHLEEAESVLFELRNAYMGTGLGTNDNRARAIEKMRLRIIGYINFEKEKEATRC